MFVTKRAVGKQTDKQGENGIGKQKAKEKVKYDRENSENYENNDDESSKT